MTEELVPVVLGVCLQDEALIWQSYTTLMQRNSWLLGLAFTDATFPSFNQTRGFVSGHVSVLIYPWPVRRIRSNRDPLLPPPPPKKKSLQDPTIKTNRPRVLFPQQWRHVNPPPSPQVNRKHWGKTSVSVAISVFDTPREMKTDVNVAFLVSFFRKLGRFGVQLTRAGAMKGEAEVKSLDRPSMLLLLFW